MNKTFFLIAAFALISVIFSGCIQPESVDVSQANDLADTALEDLEETGELIDVSGDEIADSGVTEDAFKEPAGFSCKVVPETVSLKPRENVQFSVECSEECKNPVYSLATQGAGAVNSFGLFTANVPGVAQVNAGVQLAKDNSVQICEPALVTVN